eukprot:CFRG6714T1
MDDNTRSNIPEDHVQVPSKLSSARNKTVSPSPCNTPTSIPTAFTMLPVEIENVDSTVTTTLRDEKIIDHTMLGMDSLHDSVHTSTPMLTPSPPDTPKTTRRIKHLPIDSSMDVDKDTPTTASQNALVEVLFYNNKDCTESEMVEVIRGVLSNPSLDVKRLVIMLQNVTSAFIHERTKLDTVYNTTLNNNLQTSRQYVATRQMGLTPVRDTCGLCKTFFWSWPRPDCIRIKKSKNPETTLGSYNTSEIEKLTADLRTQDSKIDISKSARTEHIGRISKRLINTRKYTDDDTLAGNMIGANLNRFEARAEMANITNMAETSIVECRRENQKTIARNERSVVIFSCGHAFHTICVAHIDSEAATCLTEQATYRRNYSTTDETCVYNDASNVNNRQAHPSASLSCIRCARLKRKRGGSTSNVDRFFTAAKAHRSMDNVLVQNESSESEYKDRDDVDLHVSVTNGLVLDSEGREKLHRLISFERKNSSIQQTAGISV